MSEQEMYYNLMEKIRARIKFLEDDNQRLKKTNFSSFMNSNDIRITELKDLIK